ncbi:MAG: DUF2635 domain-containing protein [Betaproteobacteria bacterium]|nr:DUF2635 domain-containing protein [Betaproteobacteria bacterium]
MSARIYVKPALDADGNPLWVRLPDRPMEFLPAEGDLVDRTPTWLRRLRDGSVIEAKPVKPTKE